MTYIFWLSLMALLYTYFGYPAYVFLRAALAPMKVHKDIGYKPSVSVVFSVYNEEEYIAKKIENLLSSDYPSDKLEILIGSDGSSDKTNKILSAVSDKRVRVFIFPKRRGKISVLNDLVKEATSEILVFCDTRQMFEAGAISNLTANFADKKVGCVSGELIFKRTSGGTGVSTGVGIYWNYERFIRRCESRAHSIVGATGAIYAIRRDLYSPPPENTILDDVYIPLAIAKRGYRSIVDEGSRVYDRPAFVPGEEYNRKVRTLAGNYQIFFMFRELFKMPFRNRITMPLFSHKFLRVAAPFFMMALFVSNLAIATNAPFYSAAMSLQFLFYGLALFGGLTRMNKRRRALTKLASVLYMFCLMNLAAVAGLYRFIFGRQGVVWEKPSGIEGCGT